MKAHGLVALAVGVLLGATKPRENGTIVGRDELQGTWAAISLTVNGKRAPAAQTKKLRVTFEADKITITPGLLSQGDNGKAIKTKGGDSVAEVGTYQVTPSAKPRGPQAIDLTFRRGEEKTVAKGIYRLARGRLLICLRFQGDRPSQFASRPGSKQTLLVLKRVAEPAGPLNCKVLQFAQAQRGKQVGNGECWTLADQALKAAGARRPGRGGYGPFVFGKPVALKALAPGDIIQFEKVRLVYRRQGGVSWVNLPHHTAIVARVKGTQVGLLHQNHNNNRKVHALAIDLKARTKGEVTFFRPQPGGTDRRSGR
jgi:uncharacterized protein (TIGR03067 family)